MNKYIKIFVILILFISKGYAQGVKISESPGSPNSSSVLDVESSTKGFLPPRMTSSQRDAIVSPAAGLRIFNTTTNCENFYNGSSWQALCGQCLPGVPVMPGSITGNTTQCASATGQAYSISAVSGATSYTWSVPAGWSITSGQGTISITVSTGPTSGNITVSANNTCGSGPAAQLMVNIAQSNAQFTFSPANISIGANVVFTPNVTGQTYSWSFPGANPATSILQSPTVTYATAGTYTVTLTATDANGCQYVSSQTITVVNCPSGSITFNPNGATERTGSIQSWTVPACVSVITIEAWGAEAGSHNDGTLGGRGAYIKGTFNVTGGSVLQIVVGKKGENGTGTSNAGGGGGGGSFVWIQNQTSNPLIAAGGGGGGWTTQSHGQSGTAGASPPNGGGSPGSGGSGGSTGGGCAGGGGGGWNGNGSSYSCIGSEEQPVGGQGLPGSFTGGGRGHTYGGRGGYGGGAGTCHGGGGGGGYSGGGGGSNSSSSGGGGGSYNGGSNQTNTAGVRLGNGQVIITY